MKRILVLFVAAGFSAPALAQEPDFAAVDADQSGTITLEEVQAAMPDVSEEQFQEADADDSGDLSEEEFQTLAAS